MKHVMQGAFPSTENRQKASVQVKPGDVIEIHFGTREVKAEVLKLEDTTKKEKAEELFRYL